MPAYQYPVSRVIESRKGIETEGVETYYDRRGGPTCELWICQRRDIQQGFLVLSPAENGDDVYLVSGIGFCVEDGKF